MIAGKACSRRRPSRSRMPTTVRGTRPPRPRWSSRRGRTCNGLSDLESFKRVLAPFDGVVTARNTDVGYLINAGQSPEHGAVSRGRHPQAAHLRASSRSVRGSHRDGSEGAAALRRASRARPTLRIRCARPMPWIRPPGHCRWSCSSTTANRSFSPARTPRFISSCHRAPRPAAARQHRPVPRRRAAGRGGRESGHTSRSRRSIQGRDFGKTVEILTGLDPTDAVVVNPPDSINDGMHVRIAPPPPKNAAAQGGGHAAP